MGLILKTAPAAEPISVADAKDYPHVVSLSEDALIALLVKAAREFGEAITNRAWVTQTWELVLDGFPTGGIVIPLPPLQSITSVKYIDEDGYEQTLDSSLYHADVDSEPGLIVPAYGESWPSARDEINAVRVRFVAGWLTTDAIPEMLKMWLKVRVGTLYMQREAIVIGQTVEAIPRDFVDGLLDPYRIITF